jgi:GNAT superfamily N-acetyltransferase
MTEPYNATESDIPELLVMGRRFYEESGYSGFSEYNEETTAELFQRLIESNEGFLMRTEHGMLGGVVFPVFFDSDSKLVQELFWWVSPEGRKTGEGKALIDAFESWGQKIGAKGTIMLGIESLPAISSVYRSRGYVPIEQSWMRVN